MVLRGGAQKTSLFLCESIKTAYLRFDEKDAYGWPDYLSYTLVEITLTSIMSGPTLDSMHEETHKGKYMEHIEEIYMEYIGNI